MHHAGSPLSVHGRWLLMLLLRTAHQEPTPRTRLGNTSIRNELAAPRCAMPSRVRPRSQVTWLHVAYTRTHAECHGCHGDAAQQLACSLALCSFGVGVSRRTMSITSAVSLLYTCCACTLCTSALLLRWGTLPPPRFTLAGGCRRCGEVLLRPLPLLLLLLRPVWWQ